MRLFKNTRFEIVIFTAQNWWDQLCEEWREGFQQGRLEFDNIRQRDLATIQDYETIIQRQREKIVELTKAVSHVHFPSDGVLFAGPVAEAAE